ncbi:unnamed protein product [Bursaphelenchus xylophilus]|uniref:(pine wood nematode) hypothetical protein n=1 Tax=Bursaphelenchus xylophilus TaxID=6326 RepID=A0A7I8X8S9_BURXY|nr:unnamed protein product [Bursaphelenchus xylophilus]CAG9118790.1 unnamed protein product [Bursaphelenchus xylophilus]
MYTMSLAFLIIGFSAVQASLTEDACETVAEWRQPTEAYTPSDELVEVVQDVGPQVFYTVRCNETQETRPCAGIQNGLESHCETRFNLVMALTYVKQAGAKRSHLNDIIRDAKIERPTKWQMIKIPGQCVCTGLRAVRRRQTRLFDALLL